MQRQYILNRRLHNMYNDEQNKYLNSKIREAKSYIDLNCPKSFKFYQKEFKEGLTKELCKYILLIFNYYSEKK